MKRVVLVGVGMVADTHVAAMAASDAVELYGVLSANADRAEAFAAKCADIHGMDAPKVFENMEAVVADDQVDFVDICTPPNARLDLVQVLVAARVPVLMEKPIERTAEAAETIVRLCEEADVPLGIVFQHRMRESSQAMAGLLARGALGDLALVEIAVPWWRPQAYYDEPGRGTYSRDGGGVMISQAIHTLDLALTLTGPVSKVQAMTATTKLHSMESEDFVTAGLVFDTGVPGSFVASTASFPGHPESIALHGTKGSATLKSGQLTVDWQDGSSEVIGEAGGTGGGADPMAFTHEWHQGVLEDFAAALDEGRPPAASGRDALMVHRLIAALTLSSEQERAIHLSDLEQS
ncbi:putative dehydrogenase [Aliiruegeria haliotis]|uniref:Putative dehydrogenase n=1 Tax=Aliiruegeria haliotis TaxID=1280846 RepID=A0A2T0RL59_9RHOB|nr:Gfo/Idh/MocA family oxidoreductase [Aliiruegeria haliotis]PRY21843.1 putative dehydrogenase [Aliiruegeria haliotis]